MGNGKHGERFSLIRSVQTGSGDHHWVLWVKWPGRDAGHSPLLSATVTNEYNYTFPPTLSTFIAHAEAT